jgi:hypothetical protein
MAALAAAIRLLLDDPTLKEWATADDHAEFPAAFTRETVRTRMIDCYQAILHSQG